MQTVLRRVGMWVGPLLAAAALPWLLPPVRVTVALEQGPARDWVCVYRWPEVALGSVLLVAGLVAGFLGPGRTRWASGGVPAAAVAVLAGVGFAWNDYHGWWWHTAGFTVPLSLAAALAGGVAVGRALARLPVRAAAGIWVGASAALAAALVLTNRYGYFDYSGIDAATGPSFFPDFRSYAGDYLPRLGAIVLYKIGLGGVLATALAAGAVSGRRRRGSEASPGPG